MEYTKHISILESNGHSIISVDDYELFDYLDDFFAGKEIIEEYITKEVNQQGIEIHSPYFKAGIKPQFILQQLAEIPADEIERIYALNN
jgi:hypothetical protein